MGSASDLQENMAMQRFKTMDERLFCNTFWFWKNSGFSST